MLLEWPEVYNKELYGILSYDFLIECAKNKRILEWNHAYEAYLKSEWEKLFPDERYDMENIGKLFFDGSDFVRPNYNRKDFRNAIQEGAKFIGLDLEGASFYCSRLEGACFSEAHLEGTDFSNAHLEGAKFILAIVNGETLFNDNIIDTKTDFTGTSLSSARIYPELRTQLERNIRQLRWTEWYNKSKLYPILGKIKNPNIVYISPRNFPEEPEWYMKRCWVDTIINTFVRTFWRISDYGSSTKRIIVVFFGWNILWACIYFYLLPFISGLFSAGTTTTVLNVSNIWAAILQTNLMMFSITDLATEGLDILPMFFVTIHIVVGYFILAALITRLGIMFQNLSP